MLENFPYWEKLFHFDREGIPESVVHTRSFGVHGYFETDDSLSDTLKPMTHSLKSR
ncbi:catalase [Coxiella endosymbiont of Ornithodoros amblus]|uniref:catalase n=1 Tax=Coxiella endosymbiont of Ornithodoros amblus TaxID=1656166 RepID=UPI003CC7932F